ncbi:MAG TPA: hypothetical protein VHK28_04895 [Candidatus Limnocylindria bacterium]|nr:hypothetical protein [Candidatus Limnocylindria bacterium]
MDRAGRSLAALLQRDDLPQRFERWWLSLSPGASRSTRATEWTGSLVLVERGVLRVECLSGEQRTFGPGDLLVPGCLPLRTLHNAGDTEVRLVAVRRRASGEPPATAGATR